MRTRFSVLTREYIWMPIYERTGKTITSDVVEMCLTIPGIDPTSWTTASWLVVDGQLGAELLATPGQYARGVYQPHARVTDNPEIVVLTATNTITFY